MNFTTVNPPRGSEANTINLIESLFPNFIRLSDDNDQILLTGEYVIAFEDDPRGDFDFNDWIGRVVLQDGVLQDIQFIGSWAVATQSVAYHNGIFTDTTNLGISSSLQSQNYLGRDMMITYAKQTPPANVPEPATALLLGISLLLVGVFKRAIKSFGH